MNKVMGLVLGLYLVGDPSLSLLRGLSFNPEYFIALAAALITIPWVTAQFDN